MQLEPNRVVRVDEGLGEPLALALLDPRPGPAQPRPVPVESSQPVSVSVLLIVFDTVYAARIVPPARNRFSILSCME